MSKKIIIGAGLAGMAAALTAAKKITSYISFLHCLPSNPSPSWPKVVLTAR